MTTDTIKDVLGRIISINKNLTEESLRNLLVASGWENGDIEEGVRVFRDYTGKMSTPKPVESSPVTIDLNNIIPKAEPAPAPVEVKIEQKPEIVEVKQELPKVEVKIVEPEPAVVTPPAPTVVADEHVEASSATKPWPLIILDSVLFLIALGLLFYILMR